MKLREGERKKKSFVFSSVRPDSPRGQTGVGRRGGQLIKQAGNGLHEKLISVLMKAEWAWPPFTDKAVSKCERLSLCVCVCGCDVSMYACMLQPASQPHPPPPTPSPCPSPPW